MVCFKWLAVLPVFHRYHFITNVIDWCVCVITPICLYTLNTTWTLTAIDLLMSARNLIAFLLYITYFPISFYFFFFASSCSNKCDTEEYSIYDKTCARIVESHVHRGSWGAEMNTVLRKPSWNRLVVSVFVCVCEREQTREMNKTNAMKTDFNIFACKWETSANR